MRDPSAPDVQVDASDLLIGVLLAHPEHEAEGSTFLSHFGLTVRDLLPPDHAPLTVDRLRRGYGGRQSNVVPHLTQAADAVMQQAFSLSSAARETHLRYVLGALLAAPTPLQSAIRLRLEAAGEDLSRIADSYRGWLATGDPNASGGIKAGRELREVLAREHPRRPVDVPSYTADRAAAGADLIGIGREVDAFAYLLASKALTPPLAVGLFGEWGSGKSFFMDAVRHRIDGIKERVTADSSKKDVQFWGSIKQIEFNAWQYVQGNLWASLLEHILAGLEGAPLSRLEARRTDVERQLDDARKEKTQREESQAKLIDELGDLVDKLKEAERKRDEEREDAEATRKVALEAAKVSAREAVAAVWGDQRARLLGDDADKPGKPRRVVSPCAPMTTGRFPGRSIQPATRSVAGRWAYTASVKFDIVSRFSRLGFVRQPRTKGATLLTSATRIAQARAGFGSRASRVSRSPQSPRLARQ